MGLQCGGKLLQEPARGDGQDAAAQLAEEEVARGDIAEMQRSPKSLMPERMLSDLTAQEAADLFEYIRSQGAGE